MGAKPPCRANLLSGTFKVVLSEPPFRDQAYGPKQLDRDSAVAKEREAATGRRTIRSQDNFWRVRNIADDGAEAREQRCDCPGRTPKQAPANTN